jgi:hypothetical protein
MNDMAKKARAAMKAKAGKMSSADPHEKVDSSTWSPDEPLNADVKTGMRPVSRRAFKAGGKVAGQKAKMHAGRKPRQSGGKALTADSLINRNNKEANQDRAGLKHVGGFKKGGEVRKKYATQGGVDADTKKVLDAMRKSPNNKMPDTDYSRTGRGMVTDDQGGDYQQEYQSGPPTTRKTGGRTKKNVGGTLYGMSSMPTSSRMSRAAGLKKGGKAKQKMSEFDWIHSKEDAREDKILAKKHHMTPIQWEKSALNKKHDKQQSMEGLKRGGEADGGKWIQKAIKHPGALHKQLGVKAGEKIPAKKLEKAAEKGGKLGKRARLAETLKRMHHKDGGKVFEGPSYPGKVPGATGGRTAHASGGKAGKKPHTNVNVIVASGHPQGGRDMMAGPMQQPAGRGVPVPPPMPQMPQGMPVGNPVMMGGMPGMGTPGMPMAGVPAGRPPMPPAMPRKTGGRAVSSYKDMTAGAGSGEGRLEKTEIQKKKHK